MIIFFMHRNFRSALLVYLYAHSRFCSSSFIAFLYPRIFCIICSQKGEQRHSICTKCHILFFSFSFFFYLKFISFSIYYPFPPHFLNEIGSWPLNRRARLPFRMFIVIPDLGFFLNIIERIKCQRVVEKKTMLNADVGAIARSHYFYSSNTKEWKK